MYAIGMIDQIRSTHECSCVASDVTQTARQTPARTHTHTIKALMSAL
jgi:hypothetical protein